MNCICGYEYMNEEIDHDDTMEPTQKGTEKFIELNCHATIKVDLRYGQGIEEVSLFACPKCDTVKMERY